MENQVVSKESVCSWGIAYKLERIILQSINGGGWNDVRSTVKGFTRNQLYQWYVEECKKSNTPVNKIIEKEFGDIS
jgi:hypothetical protein